MKRLRKLIKWLGIAGLVGSLLGVLAIVGMFYYVSPRLPPIDSLKDVRFQVPLRVYSADGRLMAEFGEKRRSPLRYEQIPPLLIKAVLGAEDDRFFEHPGVDYQGILRAVGLLLLTGEKAQGGSTITMQVARNFFLSREKTFLRKFSEILLALKIEKALSKQEILELYLNKIYLGNRAYGVGAAAKVYYGKPIDELSLPELAMIAGLPKAPSRYNPIVNPQRAVLRRNYVLGRMRQLGFIDEATYQAAVKAPVTARLHRQAPELEAPYAAEMARKFMLQRYGNGAYTEGYRVYTTIDSRLQAKANRALRYNLLAYEERHGYRGPEQHLDALDYSEPQQWEAALQQRPRVPLLHAGVVIEVGERSALVYLRGGRIAHLCWRGLRWAAPYVDGNRPGRAPRRAGDILAAGDVIRLYDAGGGRWSLGQIPQVEGALVSLRPRDGAIISVVGGYDFYRSKFNRAAQARRQPGSNFKPFIYSAALERGYTAATLINDAPVVFRDPGLEDIWRPENYSGKFFGPTRLREALVKSRNLVSIRILRSIGVPYALNYVKRFGFDPRELPRNLSLALGSASLTPLQIVRGYAVFANGGYLVEPYIVARVEDNDGQVLFEADPAVVCERDCSVESEDGGLRLLRKAPRTVSPENVYIMTSIMQDIVKRGTGRRARVLKRGDLAGKTGTTNDQRDAWFSGFNPDVVATAWVGFDEPRPLGDHETGGRAALPMWISFMREALKGLPEKPLVQPPGIVTVRIDPKTGLLAGPDFPGAIFEIFREQNVPTQKVEHDRQAQEQAEDMGGNILELF